MKVGFIGLGHMGTAMAKRLLEAGHEVTVYNRSPDKTRELVQQGAHSATTIAAACQGDAVITMLADDRALNEIVRREDGLLASLAPNTIHISMSTISVALSEELADLHATAGRQFIAAPVFGRPEAAAGGKLYIVTGGDSQTIDTCAPLFQVMGQKTVRIGDQPQAANLVKLTGNFITGSILEALGEAIALIRKSGIDPHKYFDLLTSTIFQGPVFTNYGGLIANQKFQPAAFAAPLAEKDLRLALAAAESLRVPMPLASLVHDRLQTVVARGGENLDWSAIGQLAATDAGLDTMNYSGNQSG
jgi:3-hydroxyisobutyrate dehydrogenase-like beta-hydroxyacid dehydrogenase